MLQFEELRLKLQGMEPELRELKQSLNIDKLGIEIAELERKAAEPSFWDDMENSQKVLQRTAQLKASVETYNKLQALYEDTLTLIELAEEALKDLISPNAVKEVTPQLILNVVAEHFGINTLDIIGQKRSKELVFPRQIVMYLCGDMTSESLQNIGKALGGRDHTTIIHGTKKIASELKTDENLKNTIDILKKKINPQ